MKPWAVAVILVALVAVMLVAALAIHQAPPRCMGDLYASTDPCNEPAA